MSARLDANFRPRRILLIQLGPIYEIIQSLPVLNAIRMRFPRAEIAFLVEDQMVNLLTRHPAIDRLVIAKKNWYKKWEQIRLVKKRLKAFTPDLCFELEGTFRGAFAAWLSGAKYRVGFSKKHSQNFAWFFNNMKVVVDSSAPVEKKLQLLETVGIMGTSIAYDLAQTPHEEDLAQHICREHDLVGVPFALIHVSELLRKNDLHLKISDYLAAKWQIPILVLWQNDRERLLAEELVRDVNGAIEVTPELSIPLTVAMMRKSLFFIGAEIDTLHLAAAAKTPCFGVLNLSKNNIPYQSSQSCWVSEASTTAELLDACDRMLKSLLPERHHRQGA